MMLRSMLFLAAVSGTVSAIVAAVITAHGTYTPAHSQPERVVAQEFVVVDADGSERASLGRRDDGTVNLQLTDTSGLVRLDLGANANPAVRMFDPSGAPGLLLGSGEDGVGAVMIRGPTTKSCCSRLEPDRVSLS